MPEVSDIQHVMMVYFKGMRLTLIRLVVAICAVKMLTSCTTYRTAEYRGVGAYSTASAQSKYSGNQAVNHAGSLIWPVERVRVTQKFAPPKNPKHDGIDLGGSKNTPIIAAHTGRVIYAGRGFRGYGKMVMIESGDKWASIYAHLNKIKVKEGQVVHAGTTIGAMGRTGRATGVHLHFELMKDKMPVNPIKYLPDLDRIANK